MVRLAYNLVRIPKIVETTSFAKRTTELLSAAGIEDLGVPSITLPTMNDVKEFCVHNQNFRFKAHNVFGAPFPGNCGVVGAFASHYAIWRRMTETRHDAVLVLEDESYLTEDFIHTVNCMLLCAPVNWDFMSLFVPSNQAVLYNEQKHQGIAPGLCHAFQTSGAMAYIVSQKGALTALYDIGVFGFALPIDLYIWGRGPGRFVNYSLLPHLPPAVRVAGDHVPNSQQVGEAFRTDEEMPLLEESEKPPGNLIH